MNAQPSKQDKQVAWIEKHVGGTVERCESQGRWRPAWFVDVRLDGKCVPLYVRGDRGEEFPPWPLEYEANLIKALERGGIPVPHIYGMYDEPLAIVMSLSPGNSNVGTTKTEAERLSILEHLADILAAMHSMDTTPFQKAGARLPETPQDIALNYYRDSL